MTSFTDLVDVAAERLGGAVLFANDEFFAPKEALLKAAKPEWREGVYTERGKWMDGWETRRRRTPGHDWCLIRLGLPAVLRGIVIDTAFFRGNYPEACSLEACFAPGLPEPEALAAGRIAPWTEVLARSPLAGDAENPFPIAYDGPVTHLRFNIYPDGGVARLRAFGEPRPDPRLQPGVETDLAALERGGMVVATSDQNFGRRHNLILPGRSTHMGDGWETRRRRGPGHDWTIVRLAARGVISAVEIDTDHYKGNAPGSCSLEGCDAPGAVAETLTEARASWTELLAQTPLQPHARHRFDALTGAVPATHARLNIFPDGGIARLRLIGRVAGSR
jgi:allantoicase